MFPRFCFRHVATDAVLERRRGFDHRMCLVLVAGGATLVIVRRLAPAERPVGLVAGEARERPLAFQEARALSEIKWLVACVPGVVPVDGHAGRQGLAVTRAAEFVELHGAEPSRVLDRPPRPLAVAAARRLGMKASGPVACLATDARLGRQYLEPFAEREAPGRVAPETAQDCRIGIEGPVEHAESSRQAPGLEALVSRRRVQDTGCRIVCEVVLDIGVFVLLADERDGVAARAEGPLDWHFRHALPV